MTEEMEDTALLTKADLDEALIKQAAELSAGGLFPDLNLREVWKFAEACHKSGLLKKGTNLEAAFITIIAGNQRGIDPLTALTQCYWIDGKFSMDADLMIGYAAKHYGIEVALVKSDGNGATYKFKGGGYRKWQEFSYSRKEAEAAGYLPGKKDSNWATSPKDMLRARCKTKGLRAIYPGKFSGFYTRDELNDAGVVDVEGEVVDTVTPKGAGAKAAKDLLKPVKESELLNGKVEVETEMTGELGFKTAPR